MVLLSDNIMPILGFFLQLSTKFGSHRGSQKHLESGEPCFYLSSYFHVHLLSLSLCKLYSINSREMFLGIERLKNNQIKKIYYFSAKTDIPRRGLVFVIFFSHLICSPHVHTYIGLSTKEFYHFPWVDSEKHSPQIPIYDATCKQSSLSADLWCTLKFFIPCSKKEKVVITTYSDTARLSKEGDWKHMDGKKKRYNNR